MHALSFAVGYNIRWLKRALQAKACKTLLCLLRMTASGGKQELLAVQDRLRQPLAAVAVASRRFSQAWHTSRSAVLAR